MTGRYFWWLVLVPTLIGGAIMRKDALDAGFLSDDYAQHAMLHGAYPLERRAWDLFSFADGKPQDTQRLVDSGFCPWWTHPGFKLNMLRPLPSLLHALDDKLFPGDAWAQHLHSFVWWGVMVLCVAGLLSASLPRPAAAIAVVLFALDDSHSVALFWIANRGTLIAVACMSAALWAHVSWRSGRRAARPISIALFALSLTCGEYALSMFGYLVCFELLSSYERPSRVRALLPALSLCASFVVMSIALGYGSAHSGTYTSPLSEPGAYLHKLRVGLPVLLSDLAFGNTADLWIFSLQPAQRARMSAIGVPAVLCVCALAYWLARRRDRRAWLAVRWLVAGAALALLPVLGSFISSRLVVPASVGFFALLGTALWFAAGAARRGPRHVVALATLAAAIVLYVDVVGAVRMGRFALREYRHIAHSVTAWPLSAPIDDRVASQTRVVLVSAQDRESAAFFAFTRFAHGHPMVKEFRLLSGAYAAHQLMRIDARTLELRVLGGADQVNNSVVGSHTRAADDTLHAGDRVELAGLRVEVLAVQYGQPVRMRYRFDVPLEDPSLLFVRSTPTGLQPFELPSTGQSMLVAMPAVPDIRTLTPSVVAPARSRD